MPNDALRQRMAEMWEVPRELLEHLEELPVHDIVAEECNIMRKATPYNLLYVDFVVMNALAYLYKKDKLSGVDALRELTERYAIDESMREEMKRVVASYGTEIISFSRDWPLEKLLAATLFSDVAYAKNSRGYEGNNPTPGPFCRLAMELLGITEEDSVADLCSGTSGFLIRACLHTKNKKLLGIEKDSDAVVVSNLRSMLLGHRFQTMKCNIASEDISGIKADKVFVHPPGYGGRAASEERWVRLMDSKGFEAVARLHKPYRVGWLILLIALRMQNDGGSTAALVPDALLRCMIGAERAVHRQLVERGRLEAVIALPQRIQNNERTFCNLLVCSENNEFVRMVDATDCFTQERMTSVMTDENIDAVLRRFYEDTQYSRNVSRKEIAAKEYDLRPSIYLEDTGIGESDSISIESVLSVIGRGKIIPASELNKRAVQTETEFQYLMIKDIEDDTVQMPLTYLSAMDAEWERFCVQEGDLVVSRSLPYKIAMIPELNGKKVLATGNIYFLRPNTKKINPIYLLCYLKSEEGMRQLKHSAQGGSMLLQKELKQLRIPKVPMRMQFEFARQYLKINAKIQDLRRQEKAAEKELESIMAQMNRPARSKGGIHYGGRSQER